MSELFHAFGVEWELLLAQAVNFAVVLAALWYFLYRPLARVLEKRRTIVAKGVEDAAAAGEKLAQADQTAVATVRAADTEAERIVSAARTLGTEEKARLVKEADERVARIKEDAEARAKETADKALRESEKEIARLATLAAAKVLQKKA